jgi:hypothetical protein
VQPQLGPQVTVGSSTVSQMALHSPLPQFNAAPAQAPLPLVQSSVQVPLLHIIVSGAQAPLPLQVTSHA